MCGDALLILLAPFVRGSMWAQAMCPGMHCGDLTGRPEHLDRAPAHPPYESGRAGRQWPWRFLAVPGELPLLPSLLYAVSHLLWRNGVV